MKTASEHECPDNYAFDPTYSDPFPCRYTRNNPAYCITASCTSGSEILRYPSVNAGHGEWGVQCLGTTKLVYRCGPYSTFSLDPRQGVVCTGTCHYDGQRIADASDPNGYTVCTVNAAGNAYVKTPFNCPDGFVFDVKKSECVQDISMLKFVIDEICPPEDTPPVAPATCPVRT